MLRLSLNCRALQTVSLVASLLFGLNASKAAERGITDCDIYAASNLDTGRLGQGLEINKLDSKKAVAACLEAVEKHPDDARIQYQLGRAFGAEKNHKEAVIWYQKSASTEFSLAIHNLGASYLAGTGVEKDSARAFSLIKSAADKGLPISQRIIASLYSKGEGVTKDLVKAFQYNKSAADLGDDFGQLEVGLAYKNGSGVNKDRKKAFEFFLKSANQGNPNGQFWTGYSYLTGEGVSKNAQLAFEFYKKASDQGNVSATSSLGYMYMGNGSDKNYALAANFLRRSIENSFSQVNLGTLYEQGNGVPQHYPTAHMWYNISASSGNEAAIKNKSLLEKKMIPQQLAQAQEMARLCQESKFKNCGESVRNTSQNVEAKNNSQPKQATQKFTGSGFYVNLDGYAVTNHHVIDQCKTLNVRIDQSSVIPASLIIASKEDDLAVLKIDTKPRSFVEFRSNQKLLQGETVIAYGFPLTGLLSSTGNVTTGLVTSLTGMGDNIRQFQISAAVQPGNSGGPLVDDSGLLIGVIVSKLDALFVSKLTADIPQNINFAIRSAYVTNLLDAKNIQFTSKDKAGKNELTQITDRVRDYTVLIECNK